MPSITVRVRRNQIGSDVGVRGSQRSSSEEDEEERYELVDDSELLSLLWHTNASRSIVCPIDKEGDSVIYP